MRNQLRRLQRDFIVWTENRLGLVIILRRHINNVSLYVTVLKPSRGQFCIMDLVWGPGGRLRAWEPHSRWFSDRTFLLLGCVHSAGLITWALVTQSNSKSETNNISFRKRFVSLSIKHSPCIHHYFTLRSVRHHNVRAKVTWQRISCMQYTFLSWCDCRMSSLLSARKCKTMDTQGDSFMSITNDLSNFMEKGENKIKEGIIEENKGFLAGNGITDFIR